MRRMRGFAWYHLLFAVPALALAFGVQYFLRKNYPVNADPETALLTKPSFFRADAGSESRASRTVASARAEHFGMFGNLEGAATGRKAAVGKMEVEKVDDADVAEADTDDADAARAMSRPQAVSKILQKADLAEERGDAPKVIHIQRQTASATDSETLNPDAPTRAGSECMSIEYRGEGPAALKISKEDWDELLVEFTQAKNLLTTWLDQHRRGFSEKIVSYMEKQLNTVRLRKPPIAEQPDLAWRGIAVYVPKSTGPEIHVGPGFVKLAHKHPQRAKFELARLVAQSWAPCEVQKGDAGDAWTPLLSCLGVSEPQSCSVGSNSESGWAVSTALAAIVAPPGCQIAAFKEPGIAKCLKDVPTPLTITQSLESLWKESRR